MYIKYVGERAGGFSKFKKKQPVAQVSIELNSIIHRNIQSTKAVKIHNNIQKVIFTNNI